MWLLCHPTQTARRYTTEHSLRLTVTLSQVVKAAKSGIPCLPHVAFQDDRIGLSQINDDQPVHYIRELAVEIERDQLASHLGVLLDQDREPLPSSSTSEIGSPSSSRSRKAAQTAAQSQRRSLGARKGVRG